MRKRMLDYSQEELQRLGADITTREIYQQPEIWQEAFDSYKAQAADIAVFLKKIEDKHDYIKVIFAGAGSSAYVGDTLTPYFRQIYDERKWNFNAIATTDIVANPLVYLKREVPTVLVSFARSGNSPESVATVDLAKQLVDDLYQITITCAAQGKLAQQAQGDEKNLLLLQPEASNDAGFAMTSSFSSMMLTALLVFERAELAQKEAKVAAMLQLSQDVLGRVADVQQLVDLDFSRVIYLGAGPFFGLAHEAQLKILELTAGQIATMYESPVGFRHGPKSLINQDTVVLVFGSADAYTKAYDLDLVREVAGDGIVRRLVLLTDREEQLEGVEQVVLSTQEPLGDSYRIFPYIVYAQLFALLSSLKVKNRPDTPSPTGTVNRVVQGVIIHPLGK
ncbi:SIS domain-containing protein [Streptococcus sanguinis]|uniref:SIS domain-containing protein n=1 Tax=Streptococcus sanguinis TaxID=1305 RepID=UPI001CBCD221|nr:SIS domain-containing protein [Streptococcus sanguinis]MBZ2023972.1 SIS domain-containing protein [Streptococcus sanguinis]MBZ2048803.1 SIS domain-containing protein [Streptococcus sanguinis]MBZ2051168.1 SIS domain-containing protein [Streptococcus sanguinis]MBZ2060239.1 SIS domain-containing protein [Streptococcus sanguinis]